MYEGVIIMNTIIIFFFSLGFTFFILLFISAFNPEFINKINRYINKSYEDQTSEQLTRSFSALVLIFFFIGIVIVLILSDTRK